MHEQAEKRTAIEMIVILVALVVVILILLWNSQSSDSSDTTIEPSAQSNSASTLTASPTRTPAPTNTVPAGGFGVHIDFTYDDFMLRDEINERTYENIVPESWQSEANQARYRLEFEFSVGRSSSCGEYAPLIGTRTASLTYTAINLRVTVIDIEAVEEEEVDSRLFRPIFPECPETYTFDSDRFGLVQDATEYVEPARSTVENWLEDNVRILPDMPPTATPTFTRTPIPTATSTPTATPIAENSLIVTGTVDILDADGDSLASVNEGELPLIGIEPDRYIVLYEGEQAYISMSSDNVHPEYAMTVSGLLFFDGLVIIRDETGSEIARERSGEYPLLRTEGDFYVIEYGDAEAYIFTSSTSVIIRSIINIEDATVTPQATATPYNGGTLIITGDVVIRNGETFEELARVSSGEYTILGFEQGYYIIDYNGEEGYVFANSSNISTSDGTNSDSTATPVPDTATPMATAAPETPSPTATPPLTAIDFPVLIFSERVVVFDDDGSFIGIVNSGEFLLIEFNMESYIIVYRGERGYIPRDSSGVELGLSRNTLWTIEVTGTIDLQDTMDDQTGRISEGEYLLLGIEDEDYIIDYNGIEARIGITSNNATLVSTMVEDD